MISPSFNTAFTLEIIAIILTLISSIFAIVEFNGAVWAEYVQKSCDILTNVISIAVFFNVCEACKEVCEDEKVTKTAKTAIVWYSIGVIASAVCRIVTLFISGNVALTVIASVLLFVYLIADLVAQIVQIVLLFKAKKYCK